MAMIDNKEEKNFDRVKEIENLMESIGSKEFLINLKEICDNLSNKYNAFLEARTVDILNGYIDIHHSFFRDVDKEKFFVHERISFFDPEKVLKVQKCIEEAVHQAYDYFEKHDKYKQLTIPELIKLIKPSMEEMLLDPLAESRLMIFEKALEETDKKYKILDDIMNYHYRKLNRDFTHIYRIIKEKEKSNEQ